MARLHGMTRIGIAGAVVLACVTTSIAAPAQQRTGMSTGQRVAQPLTTLELDLVQRINAMRRARSLPILRVDRRLQRAARWMSGDLSRRNVLTHVDSRHRLAAGRIRAFRYPAGVATGETAASGRAGGRGTLSDWMRSAPHRAVLTDRRWRAIGVGRTCRVINGASKCTWIADVGARFGVATPAP